MPIICAVTGGLDFSNSDLTLSAKVQAGMTDTDARKQDAVIGYGQILTLGVNVTFVPFLVIRAMNRLTSTEEKPEAPAGMKLSPGLTALGGAAEGLTAAKRFANRASEAEC